MAAPLPQVKWLSVSRPSAQPLIIGDGGLTVIAGPCLAESLDVCRASCEAAMAACQSHGLGFVFKASFDKANRTSAGSARGRGMEEGLEIIRRIKEEFGVPATTDIHLPSQAAIAAEVVDILQIPAFLCRQSDLLEAAAATGIPVNVKKGQFLAPHDARNIVEKMEAFHAKGTMLCERGASFGYNNLIVDFAGLETMRGYGVPVCFDATHSAQRPGGAGSSTAGARETIPAMVRAACAVGIDALFLEVHPDPANALSDKETQWPAGQASVLIGMAARLHRAADETR